MKNHAQLPIVQKEQLSFLKTISERVPDGITYGVDVTFYRFDHNPGEDFTPVFMIHIYDELCNKHEFYRSEHLHDYDMDRILNKIRKDLNQFLDKKYPLQ